MKMLLKGALVVAALSLPAASWAQDVAPLFEAAPAVLYETYRGVDGPVFNEYFEMLVDKYAGSNGFGWGIYRENTTVAYRITALAEGLESMLEVQQARNTSFQEFTEDQLDLWNRAWGTRHVAVYNAAPGLSVVPDGFSVADIQALPYNRVTIYHLKWNEAPAFRQALRERSALDREAGIENFVLTVWNGGIRDGGTDRHGSCECREPGGGCRCEHGGSPRSPPIVHRGLPTAERDHERFSVACRAARSEPHRPSVVRLGPVGQRSVMA